jgi:predicted SAM-dependent methyltransferase
VKYLNLGCGHHFSKRVEWTNIDFISEHKDVLSHNLLKGIPFPDSSFDVVYHSHVLEHFSKQDGVFLIKECYRVLKPNGIIRIAIPDLEQIVRQYLRLLDAGIENPREAKIEADYNWMLIEMYDQTVRNKSGGMMAEYLFQEKIPNDAFVFDRIGEEGKQIRHAFLSRAQTILTTKEQVKRGIKKVLSLFKNTLTERYGLGKFRLKGEIHQWMYDSYSLTKLLETTGFQAVKKQNAFTSYIKDWEQFNLDGKEGIIRKPDSLFIEAIKQS